ncbi:MAG: putative lipoprotein [Labilithrix sp.]|nr:putative lipoprotein [Labilithrix sp.]
MTDEKTSEDEAKDDAKAAPETTETTASDAEREADDDEAAPDSASPEAIARRVAALGEEDQIEKLARDEERKLAERRSAGKKKKKGGGLEVAASKKLAKIGTRAEPKRNLAVAADADPLIEKTAKLSEWAKANQKTVQLAGALIAVALLGIAGFLYLDHKHETEASTLLTKAVEDERARIGEPPKDDDDSKPADTSPMFKTYDDRRESALKKYREVESRFPKSGAAILARLAEGSLLLDKHEPDPAAAAFNDVKGSALAAADQEVKGRAIEGLGFAYELKAIMTPAEAPKFLDEAAKAYKEMENTVEVRGFKELAMYHQARVAQNRGEKDKAKELLLSLKERLGKIEDNTSNVPQGPAFPYLKEVAMDRLREIDPTAAPKTPAMAPGGNPSLSPAQIRKMIEDAQKKQKSGGDPHGDKH